MDAVPYNLLRHLTARLVEVGVDNDTAWLAAGRYLNGVPGWSTALMDARRDGLLTSATVMAASRILNSWVIAR
jgi:hypothetical protein